MIRLGPVAALMLAGWTGSACAHPHIFIDTGMELVFDDQGRLAAVWTIWAYDEFYSLLMLEDRGLDPDGDGVLTAGEQAALDGFDMDWDADYAGDLYPALAGKPLGLSRPLKHAARFENGRIITSHLRAFNPRIVVGAEPVVLQVYDPSYYTAYTLTLPVTVSGREGCKAVVFVPAPTAMSEELKGALAELSAVQSIDDLQLDAPPAISASLAEEVRLTCAP